MPLRAPISLRARVAFYARVLQSDGYGNARGAFNAAAEFTLPAQLAPKLGGESVQAGRLIGQNYVNVTVRRSAQAALIADDWKAVDTRTQIEYAVRSIIDPFAADSRRGRWLEILCQQGGAP